MPWFEATDDIQISPNRHVRPGDRFEYPYRAGKALVAANRAEWSNEPSSSEDEESPDPEPKADDESQATPIEALDLTDVDGIGQETTDEIDAWLADEGIETVAELEERGLTDIPGVGPSTAEDIRDEFEAL